MVRVRRRPGLKAALVLAVLGCAVAWRPAGALNPTYPRYVVEIQTEAPVLVAIEGELGVVGRIEAGTREVNINRLLGPGRQTVTVATWPYGPDPGRLRVRLWSNGSERPLAVWHGRTDEPNRWQAVLAESGLERVRRDRPPPQPPPRRYRCEKASPMDTATLRWFAARVEAMRQALVDGDPRRAALAGDPDQVSYLVRAYGENGPEVLKEIAPLVPTAPARSGERCRDAARIRHADGSMTEFRFLADGWHLVWVEPGEDATPTPPAVPERRLTYRSRQCVRKTLSAQAGSRSTP